MKKPTEKTKVRDWYVANYPTDELGTEINEDVTFYDTFKALDRYKDVYELLGVHDSIVRERVFEGLTNVMECPYGEIYDQWLMAV